MIVTQLAQELPLTASEALSGTFGSISLVVWIFVFIPQLVQNYLNSSADSISVAFLCIWFLGDISNLAGAIWARLVPTVIALAVYFCIADVVLLLQCLYYNGLNARRRREEEEALKDSTRHFNGYGTADGHLDGSVGRLSHQGRGSARTHEEEEDEEDDDDNSPLLSRRNSSNSVAKLGLPGSHRRDSSKSGSHERRESTLVRIVEEHDADLRSHGHKAFKVWLRNSVSIVLICALGAVGWAIAWRLGVWRPSPLPRYDDGTGNREDQEAPFGAEFLGYFSAVAYLGARIPQIVKNWREKSCEGLSLLFFLLSLLGNLSYGAGILAHSLDRRYVIKNLPWLIGSLGTMVEDVMIFIQFHIYGEKTLDTDGGDEDQEEAIL